MALIAGAVGVLVALAALAALSIQGSNPRTPTGSRAAQTAAVAQSPDSLRGERLNLEGPICAVAGRGHEVLASRLVGWDVNAKCVLYSSHDDGGSWSPQLPDESVLSVALGAGSNVALAGTASGRIYRQDGDSNWKLVHDDSASFQPEVTVLLFADDVAYAGGRGVLRSSDGGLSWTDVTAGLGTISANEDQRPRFAVVAFAHSGTDLFVALNGNVPEAGLWARHDATGTWDRVALPRDGFVTAVSTLPDAVAVGFSGTTGTGSSTYSRRLKDGSWEAADPQHGPPSVNALVFVDGDLFTAASGVWQLRGRRWTKLDGTSALVRTLSATDSALLAAAADGLWRYGRP